MTGQLPASASNSRIHPARASLPGFGTLVGAAVSFAVVTGICAPAAAQSIQWNWNGFDTPFWSLATNWNPVDVPDALNETATIGMAGTYMVDLNMSPTIQHLLITNPTATLRILGGRTLTVTEWNGVTNQGTIIADGSTSIVGALINYGTFVNYFAINSIVGPVINDAVSPQGIRIRGPSSLELFGPTVMNSGTIHLNYNDFSGDPAYLHFKANTLIDGTGEVVMGRFSRLTTAAGVTLTQGAGHVIRGTGNIGAQLVNEGVVSADDPINWLTLDGNPKTNNGMIVADDDCRLDIFGLFEITQDDDGTILADGGTVLFKSMSATPPVLTVNGGRLETQNGGIIKTASSSTMLRDVTLFGDLDVDFGTSILLAGGGVNNIGTIRVDPTAHATFTHCVFVDDSELSGPGALILGRAFYARLFVDPGFVGTNGPGHTIRGNGVLRGSFVNNGTIAPGTSIGLLDSLAPCMVTQGETGVIDIEVAGTGSSEYDRFTGPTTWVLDGTLRVSVVPPYVPLLGHSYTIISGGSVSGTFDTIEGPPPGPGLDWAVTYGASTVTLSVVACALTIDGQPQGKTVCRGAFITFTVDAPGATSYQWRKGGEEIDGATSPTYQIIFALPEHTGHYDVVVSNQCDSFASNTASLFVHPGGSADANGDGELNGLDLQVFIEALTGDAPPTAGHCACDMNANGYVDISDLDGFVYYLMFE